MDIKLFLADDHHIVRAGLRSLLEKEPDMQVVGEADNGRELLEKLQELSPDVVVMDVAMPDMNGMEATRNIHTTLRGIKVLALSMHSDKRFVLRMLEAGASGYLLKDCAFEELINAIRTVVANQTYLSPSIAETLARHYVLIAAKNSSISSALTPRERQVLQLLAEGKRSKEISFLLSVSSATVDTHRNAIMHKLNLHSIAELTKYAVREGLTSLET